jgi:glutathione synthase/RimK-type ligase-like ATP-grasp enzyme
VGVVGVPGDLHAEFLVERLAARAASPLFVRTAPEGEGPRLSLEDGRARYGSIDLDGVPVLYLRSLYVGLMASHGNDGEWYTEYAADRERQGMWVSWLRDISRRRVVVNPPDANELHRLKPYQLLLLREAGVPVPATLVTSDPEALLRFRERVGQVIYKPVAGGALANLLTDADLTDERLESLSHAPVMFQEYVHGRDLRVYTIGDRAVHAGLIHSDAIDYRADEGPIDLIDLPSETESIAVRAAKAAGCLFCAVDMKRTEDGRDVVLDCNPSPMFLGFDRKSGARVGERLADYLAETARRC